MSQVDNMRTRPSIPNILPAVCCLILAVLAFASPGWSAEPNRPLTDTDAPLNYVDSIQLAMATSPQLKTSQIGIEVSKLGEKDTWYKLFPKLSMTASYITPLTQYADGRKADSYVSLNFNSGSYDPLVAYLSLDASKLAVKLAKLSHMLAVQTMMEKVGLAYITVNSLEQRAACLQEICEQLQKLELYAAQRVEKGSLSPLDLRIAGMKSSVARMELEHNRILNTQELIRLKRLLGFPEERKVTLAIADSLPQIIGDQAIYIPPGFSQVEERNLEIKMLKTKEKLEGYSVRQAMADHLPKLSLGLNTPDPTATKDKASPYYAVVQANVPLWAWGETSRNVQRASLNNQKLAIANSILINAGRDAWDTARLDLGVLQEKLRMANASRELRDLESKRKAIGYQVGNLSYESLVEANIAAIMAKIDVISAEEQLHTARLKVRVQSGELLHQHIRTGDEDLE